MDKRGMSLSNKAQVTVFIIIAIVIVCAVVLTYFISTNKKNATNPDIAQIKQYVDDCVKETAQDSVYFLGVQGGSIVLNGDELTTVYGTFNFLYDTGENKVPSITEMESQLELYVDNILGTCVNFTEFPGYQITSREVKTTAKIQEDKVVFKIKYPVSIEKAGATSEINDFETNVNVRLTHIREIVNQLVESEKENDPYTDMTLLSSFDVGVSIIPYNETIIVFEIADNKSIINGEAYAFDFASKHKNLENE